MSRPLRRAGAGLAVAAVLAGAVACDDDQPSTAASERGASTDVSITTDESLTDGLRALSETGASGELKTLTDFDWDAVHVFAEGATRAEIEAAAGAPVVRDTRYFDAGNLLVFSLDGEVVRAISVVPDLLAADHPTWTVSVRLEPAGADTPAVLRLVEG